MNAFGRGVIRATGRVVSHDWGQDCYRAQGIGYAKLTVIGRDGQRDELEQQFDAFQSSRLTNQLDTALIETTVVVEVMGGDDTASVLLRLPDGTSREVRLGVSPVELRAQAGTQPLELTVTRTSAASVPTSRPSRPRGPRVR